MVKKAASNEPTSNNIYTNIDLPLIMANILLDGRSDKSRQAFVIFFTDGTPDPIAAPKQENGKYLPDTSTYFSQDGMQSPITGNHENPNDRGRRIRNKYPFNYFYKIASKDLRDDNVKIFLLKTGTDSQVAGEPFKIWNNITRGKETRRDRDNSDGGYKDHKLLPVNDNNSSGSDLPGSTSSSTDYIHVIGAISSASEAISVTDDAVKLIEDYLNGSGSGQSAPLNCTVTDVINYDLFTIVDKSWKSNINKDKITYDSSKKTIKWPINGINYGDKVKTGSTKEWPYIEFDITLNDTSKSGQLNTNYIKNIYKSNDQDTYCKVRTGVEGEDFDVPSPWLPREGTPEQFKVYANWFLRKKNSSGKYEYTNISEISRYSKPYDTAGSYSVSNIEDGRSTGHKYIGCCTQDGNIELKDAVIGTLSDANTTSATVELTSAVKEKTVHFIYEEKPEKGAVYANWLLKKDGGYTKISGITRYENKEVELGKDVTVAYNEGGRTTTYKYTKKYWVENGNIKPNNVTVPSTFQTGDEAKVKLDSTNKAKTINFVFEEEEPKGSVYANWILKSKKADGTYELKPFPFSNSNLVSEKKENVKYDTYKFEYNQGNRTFGSYKYTNEYWIVNKYVKASEVTTTGTMKTGTSASVKIDATHPIRTVNFLFEEPEEERKGEIWVDFWKKSGSSYVQFSSTTTQIKLENLKFKKHTINYNDTYSFAGYKPFYCVEDGLIDTSKASIGNLTESGTVNVTLKDQDGKREKTVHFVFEEIQGKLKMMTILVSDSKPAQILNSSNSTYNNVEVVGLGNKTKTKPYNGNSYIYEGYVVKNSITSSLNYSKSSGFTEEDSVQISTTSDNLEHTVIFAYSEPPIPAKLKVEVKHWNITDNVEISTPNSLTTDWDSINKLLEKMYKNDSKKQEVLNKATEYESDGTLSNNELKDLLNTYASVYWKSIPGLKSLNLSNQDYNYLHLYTESNEPVVRIRSKNVGNKNIGGEKVDSSSTSADAQIVAKLSDVVGKIGTLFPNDITDDTLTITFLYKADRHVVFEHYSTETNPPTKFSPTIIEDYKVGVEKGFDAKHENFAIAGYTYVPSSTDLANSGHNNLIKQREPEVIVGPVNEDEVVRLYYEKDRTVTYRHFDYDDKTTVLRGDVTVKVKKGHDAEKYTGVNIGGYTYVPMESTLEPTDGGTLPATTMIKQNDATGITVGTIDVDTTVNLYFGRDRTVIFEHYDKENEDVKICDDSEPITVKYGTPQIEYTPPTVPNYTYADDARSSDYTIISQIAPVKVGPINKDGIVKLYYYSDRTIIIHHVDIDDTSHNLVPPITVPVPYKQEKVTEALPRLYENVVQEGEGFKYRYNGDYEIDIPPTFVRENADKTEVTLNPGTNPEVNITYKYKKYWNVEIHYIDEDTGDELTPEPDRDEIPNNEFKDYPARPFTHYKYHKFELFNNPPEDKTGEYQPVRAYGQSPVVINFYYLTQPKIEGEIVPPEDPQVPEDPSLPGSPYYGKKILILDEKFGLNYKIKYFKRLEKSAYAVIKFPFDVYFNNEFKAANQEFVFNTIEPDTSVGEVFNGTVEFRLPSWVVEDEYLQMTQIRLYYIDEPDVELSEQTFDLLVIGRLYDFTVTAIDEGVDGSLSKWTTSLFGNFGLQDNTDREYKADTLPIGQKSVSSNVSTYKVYANYLTQNTVWTYGMALGQPFLFNINTKGLKTNAIKIEPKLEYYDENGNKKTVSFTYKVGNNTEALFAGTDGIVVANGGAGLFSTALTKSQRFKAIEVQQEILRANVIRKIGSPLANNANANVQNAYANFSQNQNVDFGNYVGLTIPTGLRLPYLNYNGSNLRYSETQKIGNKFGPVVDGQYHNTYYDLTQRVTDKLNYITQNGYTADNWNDEYLDKIAGVGMNYDAVINSLGHWYAEYNLPNSLKVKDSNGIVLNQGFIVVKFRISSLNADGSTYLTYYNNWNQGNTQWDKENVEAHPAGDKVHVNFPVTLDSNGKTANINMNDGFYPVAIYEAGFDTNKFLDFVGTH